jgi:hypothetical protein
MKAAVIHGPGKMTCDTVDDPRIILPIGCLYQKYRKVIASLKRKKIIV